MKILLMLITVMSFVNSFSSEVEITDFSLWNNYNASNWIDNTQNTYASAAHSNYASIVTGFRGMKEYDCARIKVHNCMNFNFTDDGCYARAHRMFYLFKKKYGVTTHKVFAYPESENDKLVNGWNYHVAPLVYDKSNGYEPYVIDPSIDSSRPLKLNEWLNKLKRYSNSQLVYRVVSGVRYQAGNTNRFQYTRDEDFSKTEAKLNIYSNSKNSRLRKLIDMLSI